jgi:hypothetical protein
MADETLYAPSDPITLYCYVNKKTGLVEAIISYSLFGMMTRQKGDWQILSRTDPDLIKYLNSGDYRTFRVDWDKEPVAAGNLDPADDNAWEHQLVQIWDTNTPISVKTLEPYTHEVNTSAAVSDEEANKYSSED